MSAVVHFERIGRNHDVAPLPIEGDAADLDVVAEQIWLYAKQFLLSRDYLVTVGPGGEVLIGFGRFGRGQVLQAAS